MNKEILGRVLNKELVGKKMPDGYFNYWDIERDILGVVKNILVCDGVKESIIANTSVRRSKYDFNYYYLEYKKHFITTIVIHKKRGDWISSYTTQQYEWFYKSFDLVAEKDFDFNERVEEIEQEIINENIAKQNSDDELFEIYKQLKKVCGDRHIGTIIDRLYNKQYSLSDRYEKEVEGKQK